MFKTSSVKQLLHCGSTAPGPQRMAQRQLIDAPDAVLSCGIEAEIQELRLSVCYIPFRFGRNFPP